MKIEFWGVRSSYPTPEVDKLRYGGNTNCIVVTSEDAPNSYFILDAGTGLARFGTTLNHQEEHRATVLLSHLHLQHIIGLQFTPFAYNPLYKTLVLGPSPKDSTIEEIFDIIMEPHYSPVYGVKNLLAKVRFGEIDSQLRQIGAMLIIGLPFEHTSESHSWGYRLQDGNGILVYLIDTEIYEEDGTLAQSAIRLSHRADILVMGADDPYHAEEGRVRYEDAIQLARNAEVRHLVLYHHHPDVTDDELDALQAQLKLDYPDMKITIAAEQMVLEI